jgi:hypothetical protein
LGLEDVLEGELGDAGVALGSGDGAESGVADGGVGVGEFGVVETLKYSARKSRLVSQ